MAFFKKSLGRSSGSKLKDSSSLPPWAAQRQDIEDEKKRREEAEAQAEADRRRLLNVNRYAAGGGAPAFTKIRQQEQSRVEKMQNQTFTRWVNLQLATVAGAQPMPDLVQGLASGENLLRLLAVLSGKNPQASSSSTPASTSSKEVNTRMTGQPNLGGVSSRFQSLGNVETAFKFMKEEGIQLIGIGPQDISQGNLKLILGMLWSIIQHYRLVNLFDEPQPEGISTTIPTNGVAGSEAAKAEERNGSAREDGNAQQKATASASESPKSEAEQATKSESDTVDNRGEPSAAAAEEGKKGTKEAKKEQKLREKAEKEEKARKEKEDRKAAKVSKNASAVTVKPEESKQQHKANAPSASVEKEEVEADKKPIATAAPRAAQQSVEGSLLEWAREKLAAAPEAEHLQVRNVKELFADGRALPILVNTIQPGLVDVKALDVKKPIENNKLALRVATEKLAVPNLIDGEDLANGADVDGLSLILYMSYLKQADARKAHDQQPVVGASAAGEKEKKKKEKIKEKDAGAEGKRPKEADAQREKAVAAEQKSEVKSEEAAGATARDGGDEAKNEDEPPVVKRPQVDDARTVALSPAAEAIQDAAASTDPAPTVSEAVNTRPEPQQKAAEAEAGGLTAADTKEEPNIAEASADVAAAKRDDAITAPVANADVATADGDATKTIAEIATDAVPTTTGDDAATSPKASVEAGADVAANGASSEQSETKEEVSNGGEGHEEKERVPSLASEASGKGGSKVKKEKKEKKEKSKKKKKAKTKDSIKEDDTEKKKKKKKKKKKSSKKSPKAPDDVASPSEPAADTPTDSTNDNEASAQAAKKLAPLPHSRLPTGLDVDLSYLVAEGKTGWKREPLQLAQIPERKKPPPKKPEPAETVDPVSAFWYS